MGVLTFITIFLAVLVGIITFFKHKYSYWAKKGIPFIKPSIPFGNQGNPLNPKQARFETLQEIYNILKKEGHKHYGIYFGVTPMYVPMHPDLIKNILSKDFSYFQDRGGYYNEKDDPLSAHLFSLEGQKWKNLRTKLTPTFTSGKMKMMFQILLDCGDQMMGKIDYLSERNEPMDSKDILSRFTTDVIGSCAFGLECNSFKTEDSAFNVQGKKLFQLSWKDKLRFATIIMAPQLSRKLGLPLLNKNVTDFYMDVVKKVVKFREDNNIFRNDFMQILLELKNKTDGSDNLTINEIAAQAFIFFLGGFETSSTMMNFCLFELARNQEVQERLRNEILRTLIKYGGTFTYESVMEMKYLGQVFDETLRKYPSLPTLLRKCVKDYKIPGTDITLEGGTRVLISVNSLQSDPEFFPDPDKFDPERFNEANKPKIRPYTYLPFGEGPRVCIGLRFGLMQARVGLALILSKYRVKLNSKTILPLGQVPNSFPLQPRNRVYLDTEKI